MSYHNRHQTSADTPEKRAALAKKTARVRLYYPAKNLMGLIQFIRENVRPARMEKAAQVLKIQIQLALFRCAAELAAMNKTGVYSVTDDIGNQQPTHRMRIKG